MKNLFLFLVVLFLTTKLQAQNYMYVGDNSYPASEIQYFSCESCDTNSYQVKLDRGKLNRTNYYHTLEFQIAKNENQVLVRVSVAPKNAIISSLSDKISIFFENGQRIVLLKPIHKEKIDRMQELFFSLNETQILLLENNAIAKIQYGFTTKWDARNINTHLADAVPHTNR